MVSLSKLINFPFFSSNIPISPAYGVYVSQLIRYARASSHYEDFLNRGKLLSKKSMNREYIQSKLVQTIKKFYGRHLDLVSKYGMSVSALITDMFDAT